MTVNLLDVNYYRSANPDLVSAGLGTDAQLTDHFLKFGVNEGRPFSPFANLDFYRANNQDLAAGGINSNLQAFYHLQNNGVAEGRRFSPGFNPSFYKVANSDLAAAGMNNNEQLFEHFRAAGVYEGRPSAENFNVRFYLDANPDLRAAGLNYVQAFQHYVTFGYQEGRAAVPGGFTPPPPPPPPPNPNVDFITGVVNLTNSFRAQNNLPPLIMNAQLNASAQGHTTDMALNDYFDHTGLNGSDIGDRIGATGYRYSYIGENIAAGYSTPEAVVNGWINSPGHRANMLNPNYKDIGVGYYFLANDTGNFNYNYYWTQNFGSPF